MKLLIFLLLVSTASCAQNYPAPMKGNWSMSTNFVSLGTTNTRGDYIAFWICDSSTRTITRSFLVDNTGLIAATFVYDSVSRFHMHNHPDEENDKQYYHIADSVTIIYSPHTWSIRVKEKGRNTVYNN